MTKKPKKQIPIVKDKDRLTNTKSSKKKFDGILSKMLSIKPIKKK